ncbi:SDR family NAD(P)-dependent oxidoreductase [Parahaliea mediterranea]|uniref:SDR family NAD(P)-dependent oxidoreductase n=1 Tax=Parahaliea mediterranea TaxID=651086 RepID=UPI000E2EADC5|nr:SDR family NAD(P)-dependent oxidoreductase [Parahaliea mediterranea]
MDMHRFEGRVAIVTGAGGGLGRAYAMLLAARGAKVLVNDLGGSFQGEGADQSYAQATAQAIRDLGGEALANGDSVATTEGAEAIVAQAMEAWGQVDILVNNAGVVVGVGPLWNVTDEQWDTDIGVAAGGTFRLCRAVWKHMWERDYGRIVNIASGSFFGMGSGVGYPAAKGAVWGITRGLASASAAKGKNVHVNAIMPIAASRMTALMGPEIEAAMTRDFPADAVAPVVGLLAHDASPCNGEMFSVGGGGFARVLLGVTGGYRGTNKQLTIEEVAENFALAMDHSTFFLPADSLEDAEAYESGVNWNAFREFIG